MRTLLLLACMAFLSYTANSQNLKFKSDSLSAAYGYIRKIDVLPPGQHYMVYPKHNQWRGCKIDSLEQFNVHELPTDRMICLTPNRNNPARINIRTIDPSTNRARIPNPLQHEFVIPKR